MEDRACDVIVQFVSVPGVDSAVPVGVAGPRTVNPLRSCHSSNSGTTQ